MDKFEAAGTWWLPNAPEKPVSGIMQFSPESGIKLRLLGALMPDNARDLTVKHDIILGLTLERGPVTLRGCILSERPQKFSSDPSYSITHETYTADLALTEILTGEAKQLAFTGIDLRLTHLMNWAPESGFTWPGAQPKGRARSMTVTYVPPTDKKAKFAGGTVTLGFSAHKQVEVMLSESIRQTASFRVTLDNPMPVDNILTSIVFPLQNLVTLGTGIANPVMELRVGLNDGTEDARSRSVLEPTEVRVLFQGARAAASVEKMLHPSQLLFTSRDLPHGFEDAIQQWFRVDRNFDSVCDLYCSYLYSADMYAEQQFLSMAQALESYHRCKSKRQMTLKSRLDSLVSTFEPVVNQLVLDRHKFAKSIVITRNYYTHYSQDKKSQAARGHALFLLTRQLTILMEACLMQELGFDVAGISALMGKNRYFKWLAAQRGGAPSS